MNKFLLALLAGVGIGILIAPAKGSETLKKLTDGFDDLKKLVTDESKDLAEKTKNVAQTAKARTADVASDWSTRM